jgi:hypothetical protein
MQAAGPLASEPREYAKRLLQWYLRLTYAFAWKGV